MRVDPTTPAFSHLATQWHAIDWETSHRRVRELQVRIAKAAKNEQWRRLKSLQRLLVRSFSAKAIAVKRVTENRGKKTAGVDGELWDTPITKWGAIERLTRRGYKPKPLRRVYIPKSNGKLRPLGIPTMLDRAMQALYLLALEPVSETTADRNSYGFRPMRSTADAIEQCFVNLSRSHSSEWVLEGDIKGCFDNISHDWLIANVPMDRTILRKWLKAGYMESNILRPTKAGTPQGGIISPVLANLALDGLEKELEAQFGRKNTKASYKTKVNYVRYADDFIITGISRDLLVDEVKPLVEAFMARRGLSLSPEKSVITHIEAGFDFLGQNVRKYRGKCLIKPSHKNLKTFLANVRSVLNGNKTKPAWWIIEKLNPMIRGWANYHRSVVAKETFNYVDYRIWKMLWQWCKRRHQKRRKRWIRGKYFKTVKTRSWVFQGIAPSGQRLSLLYASDTPIKRHTKIKAEANPYDPVYEEYFEQRLERAWRNSEQGRRKTYQLWNRQLKCCPLCKQLITFETGWNVHHIIERHKGGSNKLENLVMVHPNCHRQIHCRI
ncbi:MAG: group II intron reverse transcriptase/maturase [Xanthomonadales bacterium]|nr:group II intron reverse transcriptase/maturase [Xanthomonadales bacterium]